MKPAREPTSERLRLDKWLWAARFYKTRSLACEDIDKGRVSVNGLVAKPSRELRPGDAVDLRSGPLTRSVVVKALSGVRGPASAAALLYEETAASKARREALQEQRRLAPEPAQAITQGRPSKRDRRELGQWNDRWSASIDEAD
jgi:ribosome-associated heat shock protein Hsp15